MRTSNLLSGAVMALAIGVMTGCSDNLAVDDGQGKVDRDQTRYLNVTIVNPSAAGSRATADGNFVDGSTAENFVENMTIVFYDAQGLPTGTPFTLKNLTTNEGNGFGVDDPKDPNVEKIWTSVVPITLAQGSNLPAQAVAFINPVTTAAIETMSLAQVNEFIVSSVKNGSGNFAMSNSVYYGTNPITGETNVRVFAAPISTDQLFTSDEDARKATNKNVKIYVERYAARVTLNLGTGNDVIVPNTTAVNGYTLTFVPEAWRVNATDINTYAVKRYGLANDVTDYEPAYGDLLNNFGGKDWWNEPGKFRSYWATSPSYYANKYPKVSDDITDIKATNDYNGNTDYPFEEHYFNYNQFINGTVGGANFPAAIKWNTTNGFNQPFYARETTTASSAWKNGGTGYNPLATLPSAVIVGHYDLTATGTNVAAVPDGVKTFYLYGKTGGKHNLYFDDANVTAEGKIGIKAAMIAQQTVVLSRTDNGTGGYTYTPYRGTAAFVVDHPSKDVRDVKGTTVAGRLVALQLSNPDANLYYYNSASTSEDKYEPITATNINQVNSDLLSTGFATKYGDGIAYFNIPIEHLGIYTNIDGANTGTYVTGAKNTTTGTYDFSKCPAGSFGVVRNHAYTINVSKITGLATALRDKNQPIVPPVDEVSYYINAKLNILSWRIVPTQNVEL